MKKGSLSKKDVAHLAKLADLKLTDSEIEEYSGQLSSILDYINQLQEVDTSKVESTHSTIGLTNVYSEDKISDVQKLKSLKHLSVAKRNGKKYFAVKRII
ncbi:Asp-tRNA(Asn)/Glu-tRNA(Gln) amidotransferase subunit GatC [Candidatus Roizmanbacteria bacterium]|nr:Asp-tRNA(Asn)/Glu-tRNA(Gln) amidotransferase subunit GatC [Candidatus Roizmanbacteria bacterium]